MISSNKERFTSKFSTKISRKIVIKIQIKEKFILHFMRNINYILPILIYKF